MINLYNYYSIITGLLNDYKLINTPFYRINSGIILAWLSMTTDSFFLLVLIILFLLD